MLKKSFSLKEIKLTFLEANPTASVARFFVMQHTKGGKNVPNDHKIYPKIIIFTKGTLNIPNDHSVYQVAVNQINWP
jgi:hypothetical protein